MRATDALLIGSLLLSIGWGCTNTGPSTRIDLRFELVSVAREPDSVHTLSMIGRTGERWYADSEPVLTIRDLYPDSGVPMPAYDDTWGVQVCVKERAAARLHRWTRERVGERVGFVIDGQLIWVTEIKAGVSGVFVVPGLRSMEEASQVARDLRATLRARYVSIQKCEAN